MSIRSLHRKLPVRTLRWELEQQPQLWDQYRWRTEHPRSPHREASDIWVRYNAIENIGPHFNDPHKAVWYPCTEQLPSIKNLVADVMEAVEGKQLGGVLITKIPSGKQVYPHVDQGWHATHYEKFAVQVKGNLGQSFCFSDAQLSPLEGELYWFNNQQPHWVVNHSHEDRITLICCIRRAH